MAGLNVSMLKSLVRDAETNPGNRAANVSVLCSLSVSGCLGAKVGSRQDLHGNTQMQSHDAVRVDATWGAGTRQQPAVPEAVWHCIFAQNVHGVWTGLPAARPAHTQVGSRLPMHEWVYHCTRRMRPRANGTIRPHCTFAGTDCRLRNSLRRAPLFLRAACLPDRLLRSCLEAADDPISAPFLDTQAAENWRDPHSRNRPHCVFVSVPPSHRGSHGNGGSPRFFEKPFIAVSDSSRARGARSGARMCSVLHPAPWVGFPDRLLSSSISSQPLPCRRCSEHTMLPCGIYLSFSSPSPI